MSYSGFQNKTDQNLTKKKNQICDRVLNIVNSKESSRTKSGKSEKGGINRERDCVSVSLSKHVVRTKRSGHIVCAVVFQFH